jgi:hypothetical protein
MRSRLMAAALGTTLALTGAGVAHATAQTVPGPPTIFMLDTLRDATNNPHLVTTSCDDQNLAVIHTVLYNDHGGPDENVVVFLEPNPGVGGLGVPVQNDQPSPTPIDIPAGGHVAITLPFENGSAVFDAVAVAKGGTMPTSTSELEADETAKTADNSQLFAPGSGTNGKFEYPAAPKACTPPPWHQCPPNWPIDLYPVIQTCPVYVPPPPPSTHPSTTPSATPSSHPSTHPTTNPSTHPSTTHTTSVTTAPTTKPVAVTSTKPTELPTTPVSTTSSTATVTTLSTTAAASLAHTGTTSKTPLVVLALFLALAGAALVAVGKRRGRRQH